MTPNPSDPAPGEGLVEECKNWLIEEGVNPVFDSPSPRALAALIQRKVSEERERCAKVADRHLSLGPSGDSATREQRAEGHRGACVRIAAGIRGREGGEGKG